MADLEQPIPQTPPQAAPSGGLEVQPTAALDVTTPPPVPQGVPDVAADTGVQSDTPPADDTPAAIKPITSAITSIEDAATSVSEGGAEAAYQMGDFLFGKTAHGPLRQHIEGDLKAREAEGGIQGAANSFLSGASQFATGMLGLGKLAPIKAAGVAGKVALEAGKAGAVGAVALDPHQRRISDLVEQYPQLSNPVTRFLSAHPDDTDAEGRFKNALESLGITGMADGLLRGGVSLFKAVKGGASPEALAKATQDASSAVDEHVATQDQPEAQAPTAAPEESPAAAQEVVPAADPAAGESPPIGQADAPPGGEPKAAPDIMSIPEDSLATIIRASKGDEDAIAQYGSWDAAVDNGHRFTSAADTLPWGKLAETPGETDRLLGRIAETMQPDLAAMKGGEVLGDTALYSQVAGRLKTYGIDPAEFMGALQQSGKEAATMVSQMEAGFTVAQRGLQDAYTLSTRINAGFLDEFGGDKAAAFKELKARVEVATTAYGHARSILSNAGRAVRRAGFALDNDTVNSLRNMDGDMLAKLLSQTDGDPGTLTRLVQQSPWSKATDFLGFLNANNLLWSWRTQVVNAAGNSFMLAQRPAGRIIGGTVQQAFGNPAGGAIRQEALKQYLYMTSSLVDSFQMAKRAFLAGDSIAIPHKSDVMSSGGTHAMGNLPFKPWDSVGNIGYNAMAAGLRGIGLPTRTLGALDEMFTQVAYRSTVQARAFMEGQENGLSGDALKQYVQDTLKDSFDDAGRAIDPAARAEAQVATFKQDLLPNTLGKGVQNFVNYLPAAKLILPFVKTPTNIIRYGVKLSPVLNGLQGEYRAMLSGSMGPEQQANAIGQMTMGSLFVAVMAIHSANGNVTGGGPSDPKLKAAQLATGWRPYSKVTTNDDGTKTYSQFGRFDPLAIPLGIVADIHDAMHAVAPTSTGGQALIGQAIGALLVSMTKQIGNKMYFQSMSSFLDGITSPDKKLMNTTGNMAANLVPFSSLLRNVNTDPYMREARSVMDKVMATIPGLSDKLPARYDPWGDPVTVRPQFSATDKGSVVDNENDRMITETGKAVAESPSPTVSHADLRDVTMDDGKTNAYERYQQLAGHLPGAPALKDIVGKLMATDAYHNAPDGEADDRGSKQWMVSGEIAKYRGSALKELKADTNVRTALQASAAKVRAAYVDSQHTPPATNGNILGNIGKAFGLNLGPSQ